MNAQAPMHLSLEQQSILDDCRSAILSLLEDAAKEFGVRDESAIARMQNEASQCFDELAGLRDRKSFDAVRSLTASRISLVHEDDLEFSIRLNDLAQQLRDRCESQLGQLHLRFMTLLMQDDAADEQLAPGPETICAGMRALSDAVSPDTDSRLSFLQEIRPILAGRLQAFYPLLNARLDAAGIAPKNLLRAPSTDRPTRSFDNAPSRNDGNGGAAAQGMLDPSLAGVLRDRMLAWLEEQLKSGASSPQIGRQLGNSELAPLLSGEVREAITSVETALKRISEAAQIPVHARSALEGLRIPLLKLALREPTFVMNPQHAARRLVEALVREAVELPADVVMGTTQLNLIEATVARLAREYESDASVYDSILGTLEQARQERLKALVARVASLAPALHSEERSEAARRYATKAIRALCAQDPPASVRIFLERYWSLLLRRVLLAHGDKSQEWKQSLKIADGLIWSMQPKAEPEERKRLLALLPNLVQHLRTGLETIGVSEASRDKLLARFTSMHTEALHGRDPRQSEPAMPATEPENPRIDASTHDAKLQLLRVPGFLTRDAVPPPSFNQLGVGDVLELALPDGRRSAAVIAHIGQLKQIYVLQLRPSQELLAVTAAELTRQAEAGDALLRRAPVSFVD